MKFDLVTALSLAATVSGLIHPGLLHTEADFKRIRSLVDSGDEPWATGWAKLVSRTNVDYKPNPQATLCRGTTTVCKENYASLFRDMSSAYVNAIYWKVTGDTAYADAAARTLDGWSGTLTNIMGSSDRFLAAGLYGYQFSNVAEILRDYDAWDGLKATIKVLRDVFYPANHDFLVRHNGAPDDHYWANWDLCNLASVHALGVLSDNQTMVDEAITYFKTGIGNGAIENAILYTHHEAGSDKVLGQNQEAGRDQGHATLVFALLGVLAQQSYNQGDDLFAYMDNRILAGSEYVFKYNSGHSVPFKTYVNSVHGTMTEISDDSRGIMKPIAELLYAHYNGVKGLNASWTGEYRDLVVEEGGGAEGGGGHYGPNSGGYDQLGFGTILFRRK